MLCSTQSSVLDSGLNYKQEPLSEGEVYSKKHPGCGVTCASVVCPPLQALEQSLDSLALTSFGVMDTTLEEVFLKVSEEDQSLENSDAGETTHPQSWTHLTV